MSQSVFHNLLTNFKEGKDLSPETANSFISFLADPATSEEEMAALTEAWRKRGETPIDVANIANDVLGRLERVQVDFPVIDCCGTGGDNSGTFNFSTASAFLAAALELKVAKHGGRKTTSKSGSIDFLEALGVSTCSEAVKIKSILERSGLVFIASPATQSLLGRWKSVCGRMGFYGQTGLIGTLTNPVNLTYQIIGVPKLEWGPMMAEALKLLGRKKALVVHGKISGICEGGMDEASLCGPAHFWKLEAGQISELTIDPQELGFSKHYQLSDLKGGTPDENAKMFESFLNGKKDKSPSEAAIEETIFYNTALLLWIYGKTKSIAEGIQTAREAVESGKALKFWKSYVELNNKLFYKF